MERKEMESSPESQKDSPSQLGKRKIDQVSNSNEPNPKRVHKAPGAQLAVLKDGRTVLIRDGKIVGIVKTNKKSNPAPPVAGISQPTTQPPPVQPSTIEPQHYSQPSVSVSFPNTAFQNAARFAKGYSSYDVSSYNSNNTSPMDPTPMKRPVWQEPPKLASPKQKYDLEKVKEKLREFMESRMPKDGMSRWKYHGLSGFQIRSQLRDDFPHIKVADFGFQRWEEFVLKHIEDSEMVGLNVRIKPEIPKELRRPMDAVVDYLTKAQPEKVEDRVFWQGVGLSILLGHVQKVCPSFKFQRWYKKWKKFIAEIPECQFFQEGNNLSVRLKLDNRTEIFQKETIRREVTKLREMRKRAAYKQILAMRQHLVASGTEKESVTLYDMIGQCRIENPARGPRCKHIQPFELSHYLRCNLFQDKDMKPDQRWRCQICGEMTRKDEVFIDGFWLRVLELPCVVEDKPNIVYIYQDGQIGYKQGEAVVPRFVLTPDQMEEEERKFQEEKLERERQAAVQALCQKDPSRWRKKQVNIKTDISKRKTSSRQSSETSHDTDETDSKVEFRGDRQRPTPAPRQQKRVEVPFHRLRDPSRSPEAVKRRRNKQRYRRNKFRDSDSSEEFMSSDRRRRRGRRRRYGSSRSRSKSRGRRRKNRSRSSSPQESQDMSVSTDLLDLYKEMVLTTIKTPNGLVTASEAKKLKELSGQCGLDDKQHIEVLKKLGYELP